tara:strand:+ start:1170 stop:1610 length:441 start_codon:yes stop_codon:yes gene_type:complete
MSSASNSPTNNNSPTNDNLPFILSPPPSPYRSSCFSPDPHNTLLPLSEVSGLPFIPRIKQHTLHIEKLDKNIKATAKDTLFYLKNLDKDNDTFYTSILNLQKENKHIESLLQKEIQKQQTLQEQVQSLVELQQDASRQITQLTTKQ